MEEAEQETKCLSEEESIIKVAQNYLEWYSNWEKEAALNVAISEYDAWHSVDCGEYDYDELLGRL